MNNKKNKAISSSILMSTLMACSLGAIAAKAPPNHPKKAIAKPAVPAHKGAIAAPAVNHPPAAISPANTAPTEAKGPTALQPVIVTGAQEDPPEGALEAGTAARTRTNFASPSTRITRSKIETFNAVTTQDSVKYESGVFVRQRYIGDPNSPIGMRGSNPYQGGRVMVFMDGMPIWNPLQISFNGSPRWGLVGPGEIKSVDIISGPFSAEYSGNAMGGVVNFNTLMPQKREIYTEATYMLQPYRHEGRDQNLQGFKTFGSYGDKFGDFSSYFSYTHIENEGQPMTTYNYAPVVAPNKGATPLTGAYNETNPRGNGVGGAAGAPRISYGDDGIYHSVDNLFKWKGGYAITPRLNALITLAYEDLEVYSTGDSWLQDIAGNTIYSPAKGVNYSANGYKIIPTASNFGVSQQNRETLTIGGGLKGRLTDTWNIDANVSYFDVLKDKRVSSTFNPNDPNNNHNVGQVSRFDDTGWINVSTKFDTDQFFGNKDLSFATGFQYQHSKLFLNSYNSTNYQSASQNSINVLSGGVTDTYGLFGQLSWRFLPNWDATVGTRLERWNSSGGVYQTAAKTNNPADREESAWSPKFSLGFEPGRWKFRYSIARAYRFPLPEELFSNSSSVNGSVTISDSSLKPEEGTHHNLLAEYDFDNGYVRLNLFHENVRNAIYSQSVSNAALGLPNPTLFSTAVSSIGEVETHGLDFTFNQDRILGSDFDFNVNTTILEATIVSNPLNTLYVGKAFPLLPNYRLNALATYHVGSDLDLSVGTRYQSEMFTQLDNQDLQIATMNAFTRSVYVDLKATYRFLGNGHVSMGVNNVNDYRAFFNHPLPQRSYFISVGYKF